jgi:hypothetical protein
MTNKYLSLILLVFAISGTFSPLSAQLSVHLGAPFRENAVLQRGMEVPVWGWSQPGTVVSVEFAGQKKSATAGKDGKWMAKLDALEASFEPADLVVRENTGHETLVQNILVGEVWLASGQSNMQWKVAKSSCNQIAQQLSGETDGKPAPIREFEVTSVYAQLHPVEKAYGEWKAGNYEEYSAIAFAFAHKLFRELKVPIGILNCSFSQTAIQAWVPREGFRDAEDEYTQAIYQKILETDPATPQHKAAWEKYYQEIEDTLGKAGAPEPILTQTPGNLNGNRDASWLYNGRLHPVVPYAIRGGIWNQGYANMGEGLPYYNNLHSLVRGWRLVWEKPELPVYFHQFYSPGMKPDAPNYPTIGSTTEMRLGTWLARDIPNTGMASQIDITGGIHYYNKAVPGQRLALHALKNQYGQDIVADGPFFKSYAVRGNELILECDNAGDGFVVADPSPNIDRKNPSATGFADPAIMENGDGQVNLFYLADENRVWHPATMKIAKVRVSTQPRFSKEAWRIILTSPDVKSPRGVSYGTGGVGFQPNVYNHALLPLTPFTVYDHKLVTRGDWSEEGLKVAGQEVDPNSQGLLGEWYKMPLLSTQFRDNAVLQAGKPITFWGSVYHDYGTPAEGNAEVKFSFDGVEKTIPVKDGSPNIRDIPPGETRYPHSAKDWFVTLPPMKASTEPKTLKVQFLINGELAHERIAKNIVIGDVWYIAAPNFEKGQKLPAVEKSGKIVRVMARKAKRSTFERPSRYTVCVSRTPLNRFACTWDDAESGLAAAIGHHLAAKSGNPVGIIFMQNTVAKGEDNPDLKSWIPYDALIDASSLLPDYMELASVVPGNEHYAANARRYIEAWKAYWGETIPQMISSKAAPDDQAWGTYPIMGGDVATTASQTYNVLTHSFTPTSLKGILFITHKGMSGDGKASHFGVQLSALANSWKKRFGSGDIPFFYTLPHDVCPPKYIEGKSTAILLEDLSDLSDLPNSL